MGARSAPREPAGRDLDVVQSWGGKQACTGGCVVHGVGRDGIAPPPERAAMVGDGGRWDRVKQASRGTYQFGGAANGPRLSGGRGGAAEVWHSRLRQLWIAGTQPRSRRRQHGSPSAGDLLPAARRKILGPPLPRRLELEVCRGAPSVRCKEGVAAAILLSRVVAAGQGVAKRLARGVAACGGGSQRVSRV